VWRVFGGLLGLLALEDGLHRVAGLGNIGEAESGPGLGDGPAGRGRARAACKVGAHLLGFIFFDGAGVRLFLGDANRYQSIQNGFAFDFQFSCKIVDSNFAHLSLFSIGG
jgi:hypothetical protein